LLAAVIAIADNNALAQRVQFAQPSRARTVAQPMTQPQPLYQEPPAVLEGTIQPLNPNWDPYGDPMATQPPTLVPPGGNIYAQPDGNFGIKAERLIQQVRLEVTHLTGDGGNDFEVSDFDVSLTGAWQPNPQVAPLLITPGFGLHLWNGPDLDAATGRDLPAAVYDAWLDVGWRPQLTPHLSADLGIRPGIYTDFEFVNSDSFRIKGRALGIYTASPQVQFVGGIVYLDRLDIKLLPAGGVIWTPNDASRLEFLFPRPKLAWRLSNVGNTEWWWFVQGEYGGDSWTIEHETAGRDRIDYNDIRVSLGLEWNSFMGYKGHIEVGYVFNREILYQSGLPKFEPDDTWMLRGGIVY
jgi:hypothetical protein